MHAKVSRLLPAVGGLAAILVVGAAPAAAQTYPTDTGQPTPQMTQPTTPQPTTPQPVAPATTTQPAPAQPAPAPPAPAQPTGSGWTPGPNATNANNTFSGQVDNPSKGATHAKSGTLSVNGWFVDTTAQGWAGADDVQLFQGQMGNGGTMLAKGVVAENRPDVASALGNPYWAASGFSVSVPASSLQTGQDTLGVYLHTPGKGWWYEPLNVNITPSSTPSTTTTTTTTPAATAAPQVTVQDPSENQDISTRDGDFTIQGTVSTPADIDRIEVWIDGERDSGLQLGTTTPASDGSWSLTFTPTKYPSTHNNIYVYAHSKSTGLETEIVRGFNITDK